MVKNLRAVAQIPFALIFNRLAQDIFFGVRSNFIVLVRGKMFGITPDRHTWMLELSYEPFVMVLQCMPNFVPLLDFSGTISDLILKKDVLGQPGTEGKIWATARLDLLLCNVVKEP